MTAETERKLSVYFSLAAGVACILQIFWFTSTSYNFIDYDALSYLGVARYLRAGQIHASISAFRSPLLSWMIAGASFVDGNLLRVGKLINVGCYVISVALVYRLADRLWQSRLVASIAAFWFSLARGLAAAALVLVSPDFLLTVLVLLYFLLLLRCLRSGRTQDWLPLGAVHGAAYLAKAFALPWLAVASLVAAIVSPGRPSHRLQRFALAMLFPLLAAALWGAALYSKYGVFTTGSQFQTNFILYRTQASDGNSGRFALLQDTRPDPAPTDPSIFKMDDAMVNDPMPPHSPAWQRRIPPIEMLRAVMSAERKNVPVALKELTILLTPGGVLAFLLMNWQMFQHRSDRSAEFRFIFVVAVSAAALLLAYCMLVFITTYAFPLIAVIMAVTARFFVGDGRFGGSASWRRVCLLLAIAGLIISFVYRSSPFRTLRPAFEASCHDAAQTLDASEGTQIVSVGTGPYPAQGVGWEAGFLTAYFTHRRIVATGDLPTLEQTALWTDDIRKAAADTVLVWGKPGDPSYRLALDDLSSQYRGSVPILDPTLGEVGRVVSGRPD
jgi:hypothetical protein